MTTNGDGLRAEYVGATARDLRNKSRADKVAGGISQKAFFQRRGGVSLERDALVLTRWADSGDLVLGRGDIVSVKREFTDLYGRFIGGLLNAGKPLILDTTPVGEIYLLIAHKELMETTKNRAWERAIREWLDG